MSWAWHRWHRWHADDVDWETWRLLGPCQVRIIRKPDRTYVVCVGGSRIGRYRSLERAHRAARRRVRAALARLKWQIDQALTTVDTAWVGPSPWPWAPCACGCGAWVLGHYKAGHARARPGQKEDDHV